MSTTSKAWSEIGRLRQYLKDFLLGWEEAVCETLVNPEKSRERLRNTEKLNEEIDFLIGLSEFSKSEYRKPSFAITSTDTFRFAYRVGIHSGFSFNLLGLGIPHKVCSWIDNDFVHQGGRKIPTTNPVYDSDSIFEWNISYTEAHTNTALGGRRSFTQSYKLH